MHTSSRCNGIGILLDEQRRICLYKGMITIKGGPNGLPFWFIGNLFRV